MQELAQEDNLWSLEEVVFVFLKNLIEG